jgi:ankyrin repeat protein
VRSNGRTALHCAAGFGNRRIVRLLIAAKAAVNAQDCHNGCAVSASASAGGATESRCLLCRETPLHFAIGECAHRDDNGEFETIDVYNAIAELVVSGAAAVRNRDG